MMTALCAARNILGGNYDLWAINSESDYHEEKQGEGPTLSEKQLRRPAYEEPSLVSAAARARNCRAGAES